MADAMKRRRRESLAAYLLRYASSALARGCFLVVVWAFVLLQLCVGFWLVEQGGRDGSTLTLAAGILALISGAWNAPVMSSNE